MLQPIKLLPTLTSTSQDAIARGLAGSNADKWAKVLVRMALLNDLTWGRPAGSTSKGGK